MKAIESIEKLKEEQVPLVEVELMLTSQELQRYAAFCSAHNMKFNDWIRKLAHDALES